MTKEELVQKFSSMSDFELKKEFNLIDQKICTMMSMDIGELIEKKDILEDIMTSKGLMENGKVK